MANSTLTDLTAVLNTPAPGDLIHTVDVSDSTENPSGSSKKMTLGTLQNAPKPQEEIVSSGGITQINSDDYSFSKIEITGTSTETLNFSVPTGAPNSWRSFSVKNNSTQTCIITETGVPPTIGTLPPGASMSFRLDTTTLDNVVESFSFADDATGTGNTAVLQESPILNNPFLDSPIVTRGVQNVTASGGSTNINADNVQYVNVDGPIGQSHTLVFSSSTTGLKVNSVYIETNAPLKVMYGSIYMYTMAPFENAIFNLGVLYSFFTSAEDSNPNVISYHGTARDLVSTTDNTPTTILRIPIPLNGATGFDGRITGVRKGGTSGTPEARVIAFVEAGFGCSLNTAVPPVATAYKVGTPTVRVYKDSINPGVNVLISKFGSNATIQVVGELNNDYDWTVRATYFSQPEF